VLKGFGKAFQSAMISIFLVAAQAVTAGTLQAQTLNRSRVDLVISGGKTVTMDSERRVLEDGFIAITGDSIAAIGPRAELEGNYEAAKTIDARGKLVLPGLIDGHTHAAMTLLRGLKDDVTLDVWLRQYVFPAEAKNVDKDFVRWGTRLAAAEMIRSGTTTFADMYYFEDVTAEEAKAAGLRGVLGETVLDFPAPDNKSTTTALAYTEDFLRKWRGDPLIHAAVAPHSIYTCSDKTLKDAAALARKYHAPILTHVAETKKELMDSREKNGTTPVEHLARIGLLGPDVVAAHCVWVNATDRNTLAEHKVGCIHNPSSNMMLASGVAPVVEERAAGVHVGLGADSPGGSNNDLNLMEEMDLAAKLQKISKMDPQALGAKGALEMATIEGARALHLENEIGSLETGKKADLIVLNLDQPNAVPMYDVYSQIVYSLKANDVETVVIGGRTVLRDGKLLTVDERKAMLKATEYQKKITEGLNQ
jgi:5-methylthioadenosine/S-adenosylhomocysteine deaminase